LKKKKKRCGIGGNREETSDEVSSGIILHPSISKSINEGEDG